MSPEILLAAQGVPGLEAQLTGSDPLPLPGTGVLGLGPVHFVNRLSDDSARRRPHRTIEHDRPSTEEVLPEIGAGLGILDLLTRSKFVQRHLRVAGHRSRVATVVSVAADVARALDSADVDAGPVERTWSQPTLLLFDRPYPRLTFGDPVSAVLSTADDTFAVVVDRLVVELDETWTERLDGAIACFKVLVKGVHPTTAPERKALRKAGVALERIDVPRIGDVRQSAPPRIHHRSCHRADGRAKLNLPSEAEAQAVCDRRPGKLRWYRCGCGFFHTASVRL